MKTSGIKKNIHKAVDKIDDESLPEKVHSFPEIRFAPGGSLLINFVQKKEPDRRLTNHKKALRRTSSRLAVKKNLTGY